MAYKKINGIWATNDPEIAMGIAYELQGLAAVLTSEHRICFQLRLRSFSRYFANSLKSAGRLLANPQEFIDYLKAQNKRNTRQRYFATCKNKRGCCLTVSS
jgi:hypothetical protein